MHIHQFVHTLNYGDAISGEALTIRRLLMEKSIISNIYSVNAHEKVKGLVRHWSCFEEDLRHRPESEKAAIILHYSIASPLNQLFLNANSLSRAMIFHNLTPVKWFAPYNHRVSADLQIGFKELPCICASAEILLADSNFNRQELEQWGCGQAGVLPLALDVAQWSEPANNGIAGILRGHGGTNILHVGRLAPNKCIQDLIKAFYFYHHKIEKKSRLWLIGIDIDTEIYSFELRRLVSELRLKEAVTFVGSVSNGELRAFYENCDLYMCMSEHEGFCVPLLEAMHFELPVIAYNACAVAETLGDGGILLQHKNPAEMSELMHLIITKGSLRQEVIQRGKRRVSEFSLPVFSKNLEECLLNPLFTRMGTLHAC